MQKSTSKWLFILLDYCAAALAWALFFYFRKTQVEYTDFVINTTFWVGIFVVPLFWVAIYYIIGTYYDIIRLHRFKILAQTFASTSIGTLVLFFILLLDDDVYTYQVYYKSIMALFTMILKNY